MVRFGALEARPLNWNVTAKTTLAALISEAEFAAAKNGVAIRVEETWIQPSYQHSLDFSCPAVWDSPANGNVFVYLGRDAQKFGRIFGELGLVFVRLG
jgi:hypothetical protein